MEKNNEKVDKFYTVDYCRNNNVAIEFNTIEQFEIINSLFPSESFNFSSISEELLTKKLAYDFRNDMPGVCPITHYEEMGYAIISYDDFMRAQNLDISLVRDSTIPIGNTQVSEQAKSVLDTINEAMDKELMIQIEQANKKVQAELTQEEIHKHNVLQHQKELMFPKQDPIPHILSAPFLSGTKTEEEIFKHNQLKYCREWMFSGLTDEHKAKVENELPSIIDRLFPEGNTDILNFSIHDIPKQVSFNNTTLSLFDLQHLLTLLNTNHHLNDTLFHYESILIDGISFTTQLLNQLITHLNNAKSL